MFKLLSFIRKSILRVCGPFGATAVALVAFYLAVLSTTGMGVWTLEAAGVILLIRAACYFFHYGCSSLPGVSTPARMRRILGTELRLATVFTAICFFAGWPINGLLLVSYVGINILLQLIIMPLTRMVLHNVTIAATNGSSPCALRAIIVGTGSRAQEAADIIIDSPEFDTSLIGFLDYRRTGLWRYRDVPLVGHPDKLTDIVTNGQVDALFLAVEQEEVADSQELFRAAEEMGVTVIVTPSLYHASIAHTTLVNFSGQPSVVYTSAPENRLAVFTKRVIDGLGAGIGLLLVSPLLLVVAILIRIDSKGSVFFRQLRAGLNGKRFHLLKFRTMCANAEEKLESLESRNEMSGPVFKIKSDPRITRVGKFLRKYSIDELPQLINVLKGEMSLVGPRPALPKEVSQYEPWQRRKLSVRPGVTCLWQVSGRNDIEFEDWMKLDLKYIDNWSLWLDAKLIARTIPTVLKGTGV